MGDKTKEAFDSFAYYYQYLASQVDYQKWFVYLHRLSALTNLKGAKVLDLGCGTGELLELFALGGAEVTGVDFSSEMLTICEQNMRAKKLKRRLLLSDMREYRENIQYDFIYCACDGMNYIPTNDIEKVFLNVSTMLKKDCFFTFDIIKPGVFAAEGNEHEVYKEEEFVIDIRRTEEPKLLKTHIQVTFDRGAKTLEILQYPLSEGFIRECAGRHSLKLMGFYDFMSLGENGSATDKYQVVLKKS